MSADAKTQNPANGDTVPAAGRYPSPIWLVFLLAVLGYWGLVQLNDHGGEFNPSVYPPYASYSAAEAAWPSAGPNDPAELFRKGKVIFENNCMICHQANGLGIPAEQKPPLAGSEWVQAESPNKVIRILLDGLHGPVTVNGKPFGAVDMPPWKDVLKDEQIAQVLTFIRMNKEWGNSAKPVLPKDITDMRKKIADHPDPFTEAELQKLGDKD